MKRFTNIEKILVVVKEGEYRVDNPQGPTVHTPQGIFNIL